MRPESANIEISEGQGSAPVEAKIECPLNSVVFPFKACIDRMKDEGSPVRTDRERIPADPEILFPHLNSLRDKKILEFPRSRILTPFRLPTLDKSAAFLLAGGAAYAASSAAAMNAEAYFSTLAAGFGVGFLTFTITAALFGRKDAATMVGGSWASCAVLMHPWYAALPGAIMGHYAGVYLAYKLDLFDRSKGTDRTPQKTRDGKIDLMPRRMKWALAIHGVRMWFEERVNGVREGIKDIREKYFEAPPPHPVPVETAVRFDPSADKVVSPWPATPPSDKPAAWTKNEEKSVRRKAPFSRTSR